MRLLPLLLISVLALCSCRVHTLEDGAYGFALTEVLRDDCGLASSSGVVADGVLRTTGNQTKISYGYHDLQLIGIYLDSLDQMTLDGTTGNVTTSVGSQQCLIDTLSLHMDTVTQSPTTFNGQMSFTLVASQSPDACTCKLWAKFEATHK